jgi:hypothetical protein
MTAKTLLMLAIAALALAGCAPAIPGKPSASADTVLQSQYAAQGAQGGMGGDEAGQIVSHYQQQIGMPPARSAQNGLAGGNNAGMTSLPGAR